MYGNYEDMRDFQMREQYGDDYVSPTRAYTADDLAEWEHEHDSPEDPGGKELLNEVMERDKARYDEEVAEKEKKREQYIRYLEELLYDNGIDY
jgi:hypothetical protein